MADKKLAKRGAQKSARSTTATTSFALKELTAADEARIGTLVKRAVG